MYPAPERPVIVEAPMSFAGSTKRLTRLVPPGRGWVTALAVAGVILPLVLAWAIILCWYLMWGLLLVPYRLVRRNQRRQRLDRQRHEETLRALRGP